MLLAILMFLLGSGAVLAAYGAVTYLPGTLERRRLESRLKEVSAPMTDGEEDRTLVRRPVEGPLPAIDRLMSGSRAGSGLGPLIEQSGTRTTPSALVLMTLATTIAGAVAASAFGRQWYVVSAGAAMGMLVPVALLWRRRVARFRAFEEQFPEALDLLSRALRAGHAFQSALGMVADEVKPPVGPEFKKMFDQQNFGLPLRDALHQLTERVPILDVRFFVTAVLIQRDTGGNLSEILDNLAHVVRERFKIKRQVRVHTAHGRFTAFVLLSLPAALGIALSFINPEHMALLFRDRMGQTLLVAVLVMQAIGFVWIRNVIKIEV